MIDTSNIALFRSLFRSREDVYARFWKNPATNKAGYAPVYSLNKQSEPLTDRVISSHLEGMQTIGVYPLLPDNTTYFLVIDFDKERWLEESCRVLAVATAHDIPCSLERSRSGNGGHVWLFFDTNIPAWKARQLGKLLLSESNITSRKTFDRMFPSQDRHTGKGYGNLIALPLHGEAIKSDNTVFLDSSGAPYPNQWEFLQHCEKLATSNIDRLLKTTPTPKPAVNISSPSTHLPQPESEDTVHTTESQEVRLVISNQIFIPELYLPDILYKFLKSKLNFPNPQYYELERRGYSTWKTPRFLMNIEKAPNGILIPAGMLSDIQAFSTEHNLMLQVEDQQAVKKPVSFSTTLQLRPEQQLIAKMLLHNDRSILEAHPAFGKTMVALYCMKRRRQPTLIIVHTRALLEQWKKRITEWFRIKNDDLGIIGENKWTIGKKITIASYQTIARRGTQSLKNEFGHVIIDECHHVPAHTFTNVVKQLAAKYVLGITATAFRKDQLERLTTFYIGPTVKTEPIQKQRSDMDTKSSVKTTLITKKTTFKQNVSSTTEFTELAKTLVADDERNRQIVHDVTSAILTKEKCLILTERVEHCQILYDLIRKETKGVHGAIAEGNMTKKKRERLMQRIRQEKFQFLIATGKLIGEGFDWPDLTHLFLAFPFSWKGKLIQYVGRVQRATDGKEKAFVYDYVDFDVPMLKIMYFRRLRTYRTLGLTKEKPRPSAKIRISENQMGLF